MITNLVLGSRESGIGNRESGIGRVGSVVGVGRWPDGEMARWGDEQLDQQLV
ncbi:MAG: hypothetical protein F6K63_31695 [Moorea sp. SIO1G6]|uniref:hypothetical protein n=1 Tax=Moorena sp. SIO1G6 TaxID=2607840 RepID=UPI0013C1EA06|nr:hypothetical protein [Moorena sp. SIO1G6]NET68712.1 hypothetical protein [Moorena sp. SIO1G6]